jgi:hypothetical protein
LSLPYRLPAVVAGEHAAIGGDAVAISDRRTRLRHRRNCRPAAIVEQSAGGTG